MDTTTPVTNRASLRTPLVRTFRQHIEAAPEAVFPLLCPVREGDWLEGWADHCEVVWSASGLAEEGCVFRTAEEGCVFRTAEAGRPETVWIITEHDPDRGVVTFARVTAGLTASTLHIEVTPTGDAASTVSIRYTVVPLSPDGETYAAERYERTELLASVIWWERSMNHYLRTGELLRRDGHPTTASSRAAGPE